MVQFEANRPAGVASAGLDEHAWPREFNVVPHDDDLAGVWRLLGVAVGLTVGLGALGEAMSDRRLADSERRIAAACALLYTAAGTRAVVSPAWMPRMVRRWPRRTLAAGALPLFLVPLTGGRKSPLHTLAASGGGVCGVVYGRQLGPRAAAKMALIWSSMAQAGRPDAAGQDRTFAWTHGVMPLAYVANAALGAGLVSLAYTARTLDVMLHRLENGRERHLEDARGLAEALRDARDAVLEALYEHMSDLPADDPLRAQALRALGRVHEDLAALRGVLSYSTGQPSWLARAVSRYLEPASMPVPRAPAVNVIRAALIDYDQLLGDRLLLNAADSPEIHGPARLALLGMVVSAAVGNALRHAPGFTSLEVRANSLPHETIGIEICNDLPADCSLPQGPIEPGEGLTGLVAVARRLGGQLHWPSREGDACVLRLTLPRRAAPYPSVESLLDWQAIYGKRRTALTNHAVANGVMVAVSLVAAPQGKLVKTAASAAASLAVVAATSKRIAASEERAESSFAAADPAAVALLGLASFVSAANVAPHRGVLSGWQGAAVARLAVEQRWYSSGALTAMGLAGLALSYRDADDVSQLPGQLGTFACLPIAMRLTIMPFGRVLEGRDREATAALESVELVIDVTRDMIAAKHSPIDAIDELGRDMVIAEPGHRDAASRLSKSADGLRALVPDGPTLFNRAIGDLIEDMAVVLAARAFPGRARVVRPDLNRLGISPEDAPALMGVSGRRTAIAAADLTARLALSHRPLTWGVRRPIPVFELQVGSSARGVSKFLDVTIGPVPGPLEKDDGERDKHLARLREFGVIDPAWDGRTVSFKVAATSPSGD